MKKIILLVCYFATMNLFAQIGIGTSTPHVSSILDLTSTTKGLLLPRLTFEQKSSISSPTGGLVIWCSNCGVSGEMQVFNGNVWTNMVGDKASIPYLYSIINTLPSAAYSLRKLRSTYTGPLVRITIGTSYYDVYPDNSSNSAFSLSSPISAAYSTFNAATTGINGSNTLNSIISGSTNATVVTWYDQSGNTRDLIQSTTANQPQIVSNGSIITRGGKPVVYLPGLPAVSYLQNTSASIGLPASIINVAGIDNLTTSNLGMSHIGSGDGIGFRIGVGGNLIASKRNVANLSSNSFVTANSLNVLTLTQEASGVNSNLTKLFLNGSQSTIASGETINILNPSARYTIGVFDNNGSLQTFQNEGFISENIVFSQIISTTERQALEHNQGAYYGIPVN